MLTFPKRSSVSLLAFSTLALIASSYLFMLALCASIVALPFLALLHRFQSCIGDFTLLILLGMGLITAGTIVCPYFKKSILKLTRAQILASARVRKTASRLSSVDGPQLLEDFLRVSQFICREQEYRSEELAACFAGTDSLREGLEIVYSIHDIVHLFWGTCGVTSTDWERPSWQPVREQAASLPSMGIYAAN